MTDEQRPDDCECSPHDDMSGDDLACAACFFAGFDEPNPDKRMEESSA